jgi:hypothetical protein
MNTGEWRPMLADLEPDQLRELARLVAPVRASLEALVRFMESERLTGRVTLPFADRVALLIGGEELERLRAIGLL